jgi:hypothetical protein
MEITIKHTIQMLVGSMTKTKKTKTSQRATYRELGESVFPLPVGCSPTVPPLPKPKCSITHLLAPSSLLDHGRGLSTWSSRSILPNASTGIQMTAPRRSGPAAAFDGNAFTRPSPSRCCGPGVGATHPRHPDLLPRVVTTH